MELENIYMLSVGQLRELLAYACAEESVDSWWEDITEEDLDSVGFYDELDEDDDYSYDYDDEDTAYDEDDELWDDEDEDYCDEEEEDDLDLGQDEVCIGGALPIPEEEDMAQEIAYDIVNGRYALEAVINLYNSNIINRIIELADLDEE